MGVQSIIGSSTSLGAVLERCPDSCQCLRYKCNCHNTLRVHLDGKALLGTPGNSSFNAAQVPTLPDPDSSVTLLSYQQQAAASPL